MLHKKRLLRRLKYFLSGIALGASVMFLVMYFIFPYISATLLSDSSETSEESETLSKETEINPDIENNEEETVGSSSENTSVICPEEQLMADSGWELTLISREHPLSHDYTPPSLSDFGSGCSVDSRIAGALEQMLSDARSEGMELSVISGYRSYETQTELFADGMTERMRSGLTPEEAYEQTVQSVTLPGTSEHAAGLAVDITASSYPVLEESQAKTPEQQWLMAHCHEYGFILRYPDGCEDITGITYEPWHYRYVGDAAAEIHSRGITLEEYLQDN